MRDIRSFNKLKFLFSPTSIENNYLLHIPKCATHLTLHKAWTIFVDLDSLFGIRVNVIYMSMTNNELTNSAAFPSPNTFILFS